MKGKVAYVVADLEGSTGAWTKAHTLQGTREWQEARVDLTLDINAVAEALLERGVREVVVKDFHRTGYNIIPSYLDRRVRLVPGYYTGPALGYGKLHGAEFALFVGLHASGGNRAGFLPHTLTSKIAKIRVNGNRLCEAELFATVLSDFGVPVAFFSGCPAACAEVKQKMEWVVTCAIKKEGAIYGDGLRRKEYIRQQRENLRESIKQIGDPERLPLFALSPPFDCQVIFNQEAEARRMNPWRFPQDGPVIRFEAATFKDLYANLLKIAYFSRLTYGMRHLLLPLARLAWKIQARKHL